MPITELVLANGDRKNAFFKGLMPIIKSVIADTCLLNGLFKQIDASN